LIKAITNHIIDTDILENINIKKDFGAIVIICDVIRDNVRHNFQTEKIIAGGYNIQCSHYRYISKTTLPKIKNLTYYKTYKKIGTLNLEIETIKLKIEKSKQELELLKNTEAIEVYKKFLRLKNPYYMKQEDFDEVKAQKINWANRNILALEKNLKR